MRAWRTPLTCLLGAAWFASVMLVAPVIDAGEAAAQGHSRRDGGVRAGPGAGGGSAPRGGMPRAAPSLRVPAAPRVMSPRPALPRAAAPRIVAPRAIVPRPVAPRIQLPGSPRRGQDIYRRQLPRVIQRSRGTTPPGSMATPPAAPPRVRQAPGVRQAPLVRQAPGVRQAPRRAGTGTRQVAPPVVRRVRPVRRATRLHRPWRSGMRWIWVIVPSIIIADHLDWCHYHLWRVRGMRFHRSVRCHRHARWNHPSIRYVAGY